MRTFLFDIQPSVCSILSSASRLLLTDRPLACVHDSTVENFEFTSSADDFEAFCCKQFLSMQFPSPFASIGWFIVFDFHWGDSPRIIGALKNETLE